MAYTYDELRLQLKNEQSSKSSAVRSRDRYKNLVQSLLKENAELKEEVKRLGGPGDWALQKLIAVQEENARLKKYIVQLEENRGLQKRDN